MSDMNESLIKNFANSLARDIMSGGDEKDSPTQRIQFMGGCYPDNETPQGGLRESALAGELYKSIIRNLKATLEKQVFFYGEIGP